MPQPLPAAPVTAPVIITQMAPAPAAPLAPTPIPAGTRIPLEFLTALDTGQQRQGDRVEFRVAQNVLIGRQIVIRQGAEGSGVITWVAGPGMFGQNARATVSFIQVRAVDNKPIKLAPLELKVENTRSTTDSGGAAAISGAGLILLGPVGLVGGALIRGGHLSVPMGTVAIGETAEKVELGI
ncbi:MAG: hypothetical protein FJX78_03470 [Armatimonadetes bacterium]|nr:hypothetical protein [Armatimonadota bacterium]